MTPMTPLALIVLVVLTASGPRSSTGLPCSVGALRNNPDRSYSWPVDSITQFVLRAEIVVRATPIDTASWVEQDFLGHRGSAAVRFKVVEILRAPGVIDTLTLPGILVNRDDFNHGNVPYRIVRMAGQRGDCFAREYKPGAEYLLLLRNTRGVLTVHWMPLAPFNEQVRGASDPWVVWVRDRLPK
jgi:hypothetical protein